jgi:hypothetical protein
MKRTWGLTHLRGLMSNNCAGDCNEAGHLTHLVTTPSSDLQCN